MEPYKTFFVPFDKEYIKTKNVTNAPNLITLSETPAPEVIVVDKLQTDISVNSILTGETRASVTPEKGIPRTKIITSYASTKKGYNSKSVLKYFRTPKRSKPSKTRTSISSCI